MSDHAGGGGWDTGREAGTWHNWSGSVRCTPRTVHRPASETEIARLLESADAAAGDTVRVAGSGHSFPPVVPTDDVLVSLERYTDLVDVDRDAHTATVRAGTTIRGLNRELAAAGLALPNMGDIDAQTVAGALATGTHGTGAEFGVLSTGIERLRLACADGEVRELEPGDRAFGPAQVSLGALGIVTDVTLSVRPAYRLREVKEPRPVDEVLANLDSLRADHRHAEFWWFPHTETALVKTLEETDDPVDLGSDLEERAENLAWEGFCRLGTRVPALAPALNRLTTATFSRDERVGPSHRVFPTTRAVRFEETEYGLPVEAGRPALESLRERMPRDVQFPVEFRFVAGDDIPLSPAYGRDSAFLAVHRYHRKPHRSFLESCEEVFRAHDGRPHWGKRHSLAAADLRARYPEWDRFRSVREELDPDGLFCNDHLREVLVE